MPLLDVSDVLADPMFADTLTLYRNTETIGSNGRTTSTEVSSTFSGVVTSANGKELDRLPEADRVKGGIIVHTIARLVPGGGALAPDEILYHGDRYTVVTINDYSAYGAGFIAALCVLKPQNPS